jgi:hypothetical protein
MEKKLGIKRIGEHLFVAVEKDWIMIDPAIQATVIEQASSWTLTDYKEGVVYSMPLDFERMAVVKQYREVGVKNQKTYEEWINIKATTPKKPFYVRRREVVVFTLPEEV